MENKKYRLVPEEWLNKQIEDNKQHRAVFDEEEANDYVCGEQHILSEIVNLFPAVEYPNRELMDDEPYFGWCDVDKCKNEGASGGMAWRETGYWTVCHKHSDQWRKGFVAPKMNKKATAREKSRLPDGTLPLIKIKN